LPCASTETCIAVVFVFNISASSLRSCLSIVLFCTRVSVLVFLRRISSSSFFAIESLFARTPTPPGSGPGKF
jgi:hypothetical protein